MDGQMDGFEIYREMVKAWRKCGWGWDEVAVAHRPVEVLKQKLESWRQDGYPAIAFEEWMGLVEACKTEEEVARTAVQAPAEVQAEACPAEDGKAVPVSEASASAPAAPSTSVATDVPPEAEPEALLWSASEDAGDKEWKKTTVESAQEKPDGMDTYYRSCLRQAPTKVAGLLEKAQATGFADARAIAAGHIRLPAGYGNKTLLDLMDWLNRWDKTPPNATEEEPLPSVAGVTEERFQQKLDEAPEKIRATVEELQRRLNLQGAADFCQLDLDGVALSVKIKSVGKKSWAHLKKWQRELVAPREYPCGSYRGWDAWLAAIFEDLLEYAGKENPENALKMFKRRMGLDGENNAPLPTLDDIGQAYGMTRERVRQVETEFLTGGKNLNFRGIAGNRDKFGDFMQIMGDVFGEDGVLTMDEFGKRLEQRSPWPGEDFRHRAARLLALLEGREPDQVPGFATFKQEERVEGRYATFKEAVEKGVTSRLDATYETLRGLMAERGVPDFTEVEFEYCRARAAKEQDAPSTVRRMVRDLTKGDRVRQAFLEIFEPEKGYRELTLQEMEQRLREKAPLGEDAPNLRGFLSRKPPVDLDGKGTVVCLVDEGGGAGRLSRYALSKFLPTLEPDTIRKMEEEMRAHLEEFHIAAALVTPFYEGWKAKGWVPEGMAPRLLFDTLRRGSTRQTVDYPAGNSSWAYSLPGAKLPGTGLLKSQAERYFRGKADVSKQELQRFAEHGFGLSGAMIMIECRRQFSMTNDGRYIVNESLRDS